jgi:hypothetical protein
MLSNKRMLWSLAGVLAISMVGGCNNGPDRITADDVRDDMSPELQTMALTREQHKNQIARSIDTTLRQFWDDVDVVLLLDRPVRLSRYQIP